MRGETLGWRLRKLSCDTNGRGKCFEVSIAGDTRPCSRGVKATRASREFFNLRSLSRHMIGRSEFSRKRFYKLVLLRGSEVRFVPRNDIPDTGRSIKPRTGVKNFSSEFVAPGPGWPQAHSAE
jgi:hypothetical protein